MAKAAKEETRIDRLAKKERELSIITAKLKIEERRRKIYLAEISKIKQKKRKKKIFQAGLLFEEAGILDGYNKQKALSALKALNQKKGDNQ